MPHRGNIDGRSLAPNISQGLNAVFQAFGTTKSERDKEAAALEKQESIKRQIGFITGADAGEAGDKIRKDAMARLTALNPNAASVLVQIGKIEDETKRNEAIRLAEEESTESLREAIFLQSFPDRASRNKAIIQKIESLNNLRAPGEPISAETEKKISELMGLINKSEEEQNNFLLSQEISATDAATLTSREPVERFEPVKDTKGNQIAQKNTLTGQIIALPGAKETVPEIIKILGADNYTPKSVRIAIKKDDVRFLKPVKAGGGPDIGKANPKDFTGESIDAAKLSGKHADLVLTDEAAGKLDNEGSFVTDTGTLFKDKDTGKTFIATPVTNKKTGKTQINVNEIKGTVASRAQGETPEEKQKREIETSGGKTLAQQKALIETKPGLIRAEKETNIDFLHMDAGLAAAENVPALEQNLELLKTIKTGGVSAIVLATARKLGVESADQAELTFNLRTNVLKQLKPTFGAQFTEREGKLLAEIQAAETKSTAGNIRLMKRAIEIYNRAIDRGLRAAERQGNQVMIDEIEAARAKLENLDIEDSISTPANPAPPIKTQQSGKVGRFTVEVE